MRHAFLIGLCLLTLVMPALGAVPVSPSPCREAGFAVALNGAETYLEGKRRGSMELKKEGLELVRKGNDLAQQICPARSFGDDAWDAFAEREDSEGLLGLADADLDDAMGGVASETSIDEAAVREAVQGKQDVYAVLGRMRLLGFGAETLRQEAGGQILDLKDGAPVDVMDVFRANP